MAELEDIRAGITALLRTSFPDAQCNGYLLSNPTPPAFEIELGEDGVEYDLSMGRGLDEWTFTVRGFVAQNTDIGAQKLLDVWAKSSGTGSVKAALEAAITIDGTAHAARTLGGSVQTSRVISMSPYRQFSPRDGSVTYLGAEWVIRAMATG